MLAGGAVPTDSASGAYFKGVYELDWPTNVTNIQVRPLPHAVPCLAQQPQPLLLSACVTTPCLLQQALLSLLSACVIHCAGNRGVAAPACSAQPVT